MALINTGARSRWRSHPALRLHFTHRSVSNGNLSLFASKIRDLKHNEKVPGRVEPDGVLISETKTGLPVRVVGCRSIYDVNAHSIQHMSRLYPSLIGLHV